MLNSIIDLSRHFWSKFFIQNNSEFFRENICFYYFLWFCQKILVKSKPVITKPKIWFKKKILIDFPHFVITDMEDPAPAPAPPPGRINCLLCGGTQIYPGPRYQNHLINEHGAVFDVEFLIKVSLYKKDNNNILPDLNNLTPKESSDKNHKHCCHFSGEAKRWYVEFSSMKIWQIWP